MKSLALCAAALVGFGALVFAGTAASTVPASAKCQFDEGYGRYTPCSLSTRARNASSTKEMAATRRALLY
jgi:hypothetical protein